MTSEQSRIFSFTLLPRATREITKGEKYMNQLDKAIIHYTLAISKDNKLVDLINPLNEISTTVRDFFRIIYDYLWIPVLITIGMIGLSLFFGKDMIKWARSKLFYCLIAVMILLCASTFTVGILGLFNGDTTTFNSFKP